jgi:beta-glucosidase
MEISMIGKRVASRFFEAWRLFRLVATCVLLLLPDRYVVAQCPFGSSGVTTTDWQRTGTFPPGFLIGVATASHQVEGNNTNNDWSIFEQSADVPEARQAVNHRDLATLAEDLDRARSLGIDSYRFSIEWSRVEPLQGQFDVKEIRYYTNVVGMIRARGMRPLVGLHHFTLPHWLLDPDHPDQRAGWNTTAQWSNATTISAFGEFVRRMAQELGPTVDDWITFNEPTGQAASGYVAGVWSPGIRAGWSPYRTVVNAMISGHRAAFDILKSVDTFDANGDGRPCLVGAVQNVKPIFPAASDPGAAQDARDWDYVLHKQFYDAITPVFSTGAFAVPAYAVPGRLPGLNCWDTDFNYTCNVPGTTNSFLDFIGLNYYGPAVSHSGGGAGLAGLIAGDSTMGDTTQGGLGLSVVQINARPGRPANDFSEEVFSGGPWEVYPEGLLCVLRDLSARYRLPIMITENGMAEMGSKGLDLNVSKRPAYIISHLQMLLRALDEGIPILGYIHWSLVDNCEWREGYDTRAKFGLFHVRFNKEEIGPLRNGQGFGDVAFKQMDPSIAFFGRRDETPGAMAYRSINQARGITPEILARWGSFPSFLGDATVAGEVYRVAGNLFGPTSGTKTFDPNFLPGCRIVDVDVMLTDASGSLLPQDVNLHQAGRVAYTHLQPLNNLRCEITDSHLGTGDGRVSVYWDRDLATTDLNFRVFYRVLNCPINVVWVDFNFGCTSCGRGTFDDPYNDMLRARDSVLPGGTIVIKAGSSSETITIRNSCILQAYGGPATIGR